MNRMKAKPQPAKALGNARTAIRTRNDKLRLTVSDSVETSNLPIIRLPNGKPVGRLLVEAGCLIWERNVSPAHILRMRDAWTINEGIWRQLEAYRVVLVRYIALDGVYEVLLAEFRRKSQLHPKLASGEDVHSLPRREWRFRPNLCQLELFPVPSTS